MKNIIIPLFFALISIQNSNPSKIIYIQPLGYVDNNTIQVIKKSVESFYGFKCVIRKEISLTEDILTSSKKRYEANKILLKYKSPENVLLITQKDIAYHDKKRNVKEWGIIGLGYMPGNVCVVSTYRIKNKVTKEKFDSRLKKVSLHEIGHNLGLNHCTKSQSCLMNDANGTVKTIDKEKIMLCGKCKNQINIK
jgi:archaemetzincin